MVRLGSTTGGRGRQLSGGSSRGAAFRRWDRAPGRRWPTRNRHQVPRTRCPEAAGQANGMHPKVVPKRRVHVGWQPSRQLRRRARH